jgi:hypothetical protein
MSNQPIQPRSGFPPGAPGHAGHAHFWERFPSRRQFFHMAAGATGLALGAGLWLPTPAHADGKVVLPKPIPGGSRPLGPGTELIHFFLPPGNEPSTIFNFDGAIGLAEITGTGTATNTKTGKTTKVSFATDFRFMKGKYIGVDGKPHRGTFSFF